MAWTSALAVRLPLTIFWLTGVLHSGIANAIALSPVAVRSYLGHNLVVEIEILHVTPQEEAILHAGIASPKTFDALNMEYAKSIGDAQIEILRRPNGTPFIKLRSARPLTEPFVDLVIEVASSTGKLVRSYRLLVDPPPLHTDSMSTPDFGAHSLPSSATEINAVPPSQGVAMPPVAKEKIPGARTKERATENIGNSLNEAKNSQKLNTLVNASAVPIPGSASYKSLDKGTVIGANASLTMPSPAGSQAAAKAASAPLSAPLTPASQTWAPSVPLAPANAGSSPASVADESALQGETLDVSLGQLLLGFGALGAGTAAALWARKRKKQKTQQPKSSTTAHDEARWTSYAEANNTAYGGDPMDGSASDARLPADNTNFSAELDPVAQADVYLTYGKDELAEAVLLEGLIQAPQRVAIHLKLAEIYAARHDSSKFALCAHQVQALSSPGSADLGQIQSLAQSIEPGNPRSQNTAAVTPLAQRASTVATLDPVLSFAPGGEGAAKGAKAKLMSLISFDLDSLSLDSEVSASAQSPSYSERLESSMELAKQCIEIGETQGARSMLGDVIANGSGDQRKRAQAMMAQLK